MTPPTVAQIRLSLPWGVEVTDEQIETAIAAVDVDTVAAAEDALWTVEVWDRTSPINGVDAEVVLGSQDMPDEGEGDIVLVLRDGQVMLFQPYDYSQPGIVPFPPGTGMAAGAAYRDQAAAAAANGRVQEAVLAELGVGDG